jgi:hypothetical protein
MSPPPPRSKYLFRNHDNNTYSREKVCLQNPIFPQSPRTLLQPCANKKHLCVCSVGTIPCSAHVTKFSQHYHIISYKLHTADGIFRALKRQKSEGARSGL